MSILTQRGEIGFALQYTKYKDGNVAAAKAKAKAVFNTNAADLDQIVVGSTTYRLVTKLRAVVTVTTNAADGDTLTIGAKTYTLKSSLTPAVNEVLIGTDAPTTAANIVAAIGAGAGSGTLYGAGTTANLSATATASTNVISLVAIATGLSAIILSRTGTHLTITLAFQLQVNDVFIGTTVYTTTSNLSAAINAGSGSGTAYGAGTTANATVAGASENYTVFLTAVSTGSGGNSIILTTTSSHVTLTAFSGGLTAGTFDPTLLSWLRHRSNDIDFDAQQIQNALPLEIGNRGIGPSGWYKSGVVMGGGASMIPRMENVFGDLLLAALGSVSTAANTPESGANTHTFSFDSTDPEYLPWVAVRKHIPGDSVVRHKGVVGYDCKVANIRFNISAASPVESRVDFLGRVPGYDNYPESWLYANQFEDFPSISIACKGDFRLPTLPNFAAAMPVTNVVIELNNNLTTPQQEFIVGSPYMDDLAVRTRAMTIRFMYKWYDPELYERAHGNQASNTAWSLSPFETDTSGSDYAFEAKVQSNINIGVTATPYTLLFRANRVIWQPVGGLRLSAGSIVMQEFMGTVMVPSDDTLSYCDIQLVNAQSGYTLPAAP